MQSVWFRQFVFVLKSQSQATLKAIKGWKEFISIIGAPHIMLVVYVGIYRYLFHIIQRTHESDANLDFTWIPLPHSFVFNISSSLRHLQLVSVEKSFISITCPRLITVFWKFCWKYHVMCNHLNRWYIDYFKMSA